MIKKIIKSIGPAFILASLVLGPGSITVASSIGSKSGFNFLWVVVVAGISMVIYTSMAARFGIVNEDSILKTISEKYSKWFAVSIGVAAFFAAISWQFGNNLGIGIAMGAITGVDEYVWPLIFTPLGIVLIFYTKNLYKILEKIMMFLVMIMIAAFAFNLILIKPNLISVAKGFLPLSFSSNNFDEIVALVATTFVLPAAMYQAYLVRDKGWKKNNISEGVASSNMGVIMLGLVTVMIIITSAAALHPAGIVVNSAADMAVQLETLFGSYAKYIFSAGLCAAGFSSLMVNAVIGGGLLSDSLNLGSSMNDKMPKIFTSVILITGMLIAVFFKGNIIYALIMAQASSLFGVPLIAVGIFLITNNKAVMGEYINNKLQNGLGIFGFILILIMVYYMFNKLIMFIGNI
ncbi:MAG: Nramp family divalent metal transporter [Melioribacteraceae bacterium]|nr:Nramp family divalent metal transporter [Melioribacteraceae bacterium]